MSNTPTLSPPDAIMANALSLARSLGVEDRAIARSAVTLVISIAQKSGDPDGFLKQFIIVKEGV